MRYAILLQSALLIGSLSASPFEPEPGVECVVYSEATSDRPLHVEQWTTNGTAARRWEFPASYSGHRSVCRLPGASTNGSFVAWFGGDQYEPGDMFGVSRAANCGYFDSTPNPSNYNHTSWNYRPAISTTALSAVCPRIKIWEDSSDRGLTLDDEPYYEYVRNGNNKPAGPTTSGTNIRIPEDMGDSVRVRVVRYAVDGLYTYSCGVTNKVITDKRFARGSRDYICEDDLISDGEFDIEWNSLKDDVRIPVAGFAHMTNMTYLVVIGDGPAGFDSYDATNDAERVTALKTVITRRFDINWSAPLAIGIIPESLKEGSHPVFTWSMPEESDYARKFGSSYTAFMIQILDYDKQSLVLTTDVIRAPRQDGEGRFVWHAPFAIGDGSTIGRTLAAGTNFQWRVSMHNSKFKASETIAGNKWSNTSSFSINHQE